MGGFIDELFVQTIEIIAKVQLVQTVNEFDENSTRCTKQNKRKEVES